MLVFTTGISHTCLTFSALSACSVEYTVNENKLCLDECLVLLSYWLLNFVLYLYLNECWLLLFWLGCRISRLYVRWNEVSVGGATAARCPRQVRMHGKRGCGSQGASILQRCRLDSSFVSKGIIQPTFSFNLKFSVWVFFVSLVLYLAWKTVLRGTT